MSGIRRLRALPPSLSGLALPPNLLPTTATAVAFAANQARFVRVVNRATISKVGVQVGASAGDISVAAYRNTGTGQAAKPGLRLVTSGAVAAPAVGYAEVSLGAPVDLEAGDWLGISASSATLTIAGRDFTATGAVSGAFAGLGRVLAAAHSLPVDASAATASATLALLFGVA